MIIKLPKSFAQSALDCYAIGVKTFKTAEEYVQAAMALARYEPIEGGRKVYAEIRGFRGVWAESKTRVTAKQQLREALVGWIELRLERGLPLPDVKGARLALRAAA